MTWVFMTPPHTSIQCMHIKQLEGSQHKLGAFIAKRLIKACTGRVSYLSIAFVIKLPSRLQSKIKKLVQSILNACNNFVWPVGGSV